MFWVAAIGLAISAAASVSAAQTQRRAADAQGRIGRANAETERHNAFLRAYYSRQETLANRQLLWSRATMLDQNARQLQRQRKVTERTVAENQRRVREDSTRLAGTQRVRAAASGIETDIGTPRDVLKDTAVRTEQFLAEMRFRAEVERRNLITAQQRTQWDAKVTRMHANIETMRLDAIERGLELENTRIGYNLEGLLVQTQAQKSLATAQAVGAIGSSLTTGYTAYKIG